MKSNTRIAEGIEKAKRDLERAERARTMARAKLATLQALQEPAPRRTRKARRK